MTVLPVVLPGYGEFPGTETSSHPENQKVAPVFLHMPEDALPLRQANGGHAPENQVVAAQRKGFACRRHRLRRDHPGDKGERCSAGYTPQKITATELLIAHAMVWLFFEFHD